ncbi:MAG: AlkZ family DNA glycosylase [Candidatus Bathyarchaeota archaeon]|nr:MAG: AlkZ family DNA glycosylase [Candidatus Bathyarchaeota archaeon]
MIDISLREETLFTLERHHLIDRAPNEDAIEVVDDILGLNAQGALNYNISLWNRVSGLENDFISRALYEDRSLVRSWLMRDTVHIVPSTSFHTLRRALRSSLMREWNRWTVKTGRKDDPSSWEQHYAGILEAIEGGPQTMSEIVRQMVRSGEGDRANISRIVREMSLKGLVCHATTKGPWYHNTEHEYTRVDRWLPEPSNEVTESEAGVHLVEMYLKSYGPASVSDFAYWSGMRVKEAAPLFEQISDSTDEVMIEGKRGRYLILSRDADAISQMGDRPPWVRLLPQFDALIMGHRDKSRFLDPQLKGDVFLPRADVAATILVDGQVEGTWSMRKKKEWELALSPFHGPEPDEKELVEGEIDDLRRFTGFDIDVVWSRPSEAPL